MYAFTPSIHAPDFSVGVSDVILVITQHNMPPLLRLLTGSPACTLLLLHRVFGMSNQHNPLLLVSTRVRVRGSNRHGPKPARTHKRLEKLSSLATWSQVLPLILSPPHHCQGCPVLALKTEEVVLAA